MNLVTLKSPTILPHFSVTLNLQNKTLIRPNLCIHENIETIEIPLPVCGINFTLGSIGVLTGEETP